VFFKYIFYILQLGGCNKKKAMKSSLMLLLLKRRRWLKEIRNRLGAVRCGCASERVDGVHCCADAV